MVCDQKYLAVADWLADLECRTLVQDDLAALEWDGEYTHFRRLYREVYQSASQGKAVMWVATLPTAGLIGQLFVQLVSARLELADGKRRAYLYGFRVKNQYRRLGIGSYMLEQAEADLLQRGFSRVSLNVGRNNPDARRFYERHGYHVTGKETGRWSYLDDHGQRHEVVEPAWRMEKVFDVNN
jgi:ribosomal protein S18 acetylase RimI-like enzyme